MVDTKITIKITAADSLISCCREGQTTLPNSSLVCTANSAILALPDSWGSTLSGFAMFFFAKIFASLNKLFYLFLDYESDNKGLT